MQSFVKIVLIIVVLLIGGFLFAVLKESRLSGGLYWVIGMVIVLIFPGSVRSIWNYSFGKSGKEETTNTDRLGKN